MLSSQYEETQTTMFETLEIEKRGAHTCSNSTQHVPVPEETQTTIFETLEIGKRGAHMCGNSTQHGPIITS